MVNFKSLQRGILEEWKDAKGGWNDIKKDAKEEWMKGVKKWNRRKSHSDLSSTSSDTQRSNDDLEPTKGEIENYEKELRKSSCDLLPQLNHTINRLLPTAKSMIEYYETRPELTQYTLKTEIQRLKYVVYTHTNERLINSSDIQVYQNENFDHDDSDNDLLWRCSNQSLLADAVAALTTVGLIRPDLGVGTSVKELTLEIDFRSLPYVRAECFLDVSIPTSRSMRSLAGILLQVYFCPDRHLFAVQIKSIVPYDKKKNDEEESSNGKNEQPQQDDSHNPTKQQKKVWKLHPRRLLRNKIVGF